MSWAGKGDVRLILEYSHPTNSVTYYKQDIFRMFCFLICSCEMLSWTRYSEVDCVRFENFMMHATPAMLRNLVVIYNAHLDTTEKSNRIPLNKAKEKYQKPPKSII